MTTDPRISPVPRAPQHMGAAAAPEPPPPERGREEDVDLFRLIAILWRGKGWVVFCAFLAAFAGGYYAFEVAVPKYRSVATLALQVRDQQVVNLDSVLSGVSTDKSAINTELEVILSRGLLEQLVDELSLLEDPEFNGRLSPPSPISRAGIRALLAQVLPLPAVPDDEPSPEAVLVKVTDNVRDAFDVSSVRDTYLLTISVRTRAPDKSAAMANVLAELYIKDQIAIKFAATEFAVDWLSGRVTELEAELNAKEDAIKDLRAETQLISVDALEALNIRAKDIRERLSDATASAVLAAARVGRYEALLAERDVPAILSEVEDATLAALAPAARAGDAAAQDAVLSRFEALVLQAQTAALRGESQRDALANSLQQILGEIDAQTADLVELNQLVREADATRVLYETFLVRLKETSVQIGLQQADSRVLSRATTGKIVEPRKSRIVIVAFILGGLLGVVIVMARQFMSAGVRTTNELEQLSGIGVLGQMPKMPIRRRRDLRGFLKNNPTSASAEAMRNLRTSILMSNVDVPPRVIMMTSSIPGEGKTTQSIGLAHNLVGLGKKVLLIEGDIRRRTLNEYFTDHAPAGSLMSVLSGDMSLAEASFSDRQLNIDVLMGDKSKTNAVDIFSSDSFLRLLEEARESYDYVIIDTPPVLVVPDARVLGRLADAVVYVVRWDQTSKSQILAGLRQFSSVGIAVTGLALGQIDQRRMRRYGYGDRHGSYAAYGRGYYDT